VCCCQPEPLISEANQAMTQGFRKLKKNRLILWKFAAETI
jgi:hypothetical protein